MPLVLDPGEAFQFDWSHELVLLAGMPVTVKVAQFTLCYSRMPFVRCYPRETQEMVFDAHDRAFAAFGGHCGRGIYDNMSAAVTKRHRRSYTIADQKSPVLHPFSLTLPV